MSYRSILTSKGRLTVPAEVRRRLALREGDKVEFVVEGDRMVFRPLRVKASPFKKYKGVLGTFRTRQEVIDWNRSLRPEDDLQT